MRYGGKEVGIGNLIRQLRKAHGLSQSALAKELGVSYQQIQKYENGISKITVNRLIQFAEAFGIPVNSLLSAEPAITDASNQALTEKELKLLMLFRRLKSEKVQDGFLEMLASLVDVSSEKESGEPD
jgi:transcriptional regulator with XRE-family HTH domain